MAIRAIAETIKQKRLNSVENADNELRNRRERRSSSSSSDSSNDDWGNKSQQEYVSISTENNEEDSTEHWLSILNTFSYVMLLFVILADAISLSIYRDTMMSRVKCMHLLWCEMNVVIYTALQIVFVFLTLLWMVTSNCCCIFSKDPTKETYSPFSLAGSTIRKATMVILIVCLIFSYMGLGDEEIKSLSWNNMQNNNINKEHRHETFVTYKLKPSIPERLVYSWNESLDFYDISALMTSRIFNLKETEEFLDSYNCDIQLPTFGGSFASMYGPSSIYSYTSTNAVCYPR